jgi:hypothetical protein
MLKLFHFNIFIKLKCYDESNDANTLIKIIVKFNKIELPPATINQIGI